MSDIKGVTEQKTQFGRWLRYFRKIHQQTQKDLALLLDVDATYISKLENGTTETMPSHDMLVALSHIWQYPLDDIYDVAGYYDPALIKYNVAMKPNLARELRKLYEPSKAATHDQ